MNPRRDITPYTSSVSNRVNASLSLLKIYKRIHTIKPEYKPGSLYQARLKNAQAERRAKLHIVR